MKKESGKEKKHKKMRQSRKEGKYYTKMDRLTGHKSEVRSS